MANPYAFQIVRVRQLPGVTQPNTMYVVRETDHDDVVLHFTGATGVEIGSTISKSEVASMIQSGTSVVSDIVVVETYQDMKNLVLFRNTVIYVDDATGDPGVHLGSAVYIYDKVKAQYNRLSKSETAVSWNGIDGGPTSSPSAIDQAVARSHIHANKPVLDKFSVSGSDKLLFDTTVITPTVALMPGQW